MRLSALGQAVEAEYAEAKRALRDANAALRIARREHKRRVGPVGVKPAQKATTKQRPAKKAGTKQKKDDRPRCRYCNGEMVLRNDKWTCRFVGKRHGPRGGNLRRSVWAPPTMGAPGLGKRR